MADWCEESANRSLNVQAVKLTIIYSLANKVANLLVFGDQLYTYVVRKSFFFIDRNFLQFEENINDWLLMFYTNEILHNEVYINETYIGYTVCAKFILLYSDREAKFFEDKYLLLGSIATSTLLLIFPTSLHFCSFFCIFAFSNLSQTCKIRAA